MKSSHRIAATIAAPLLLLSVSVLAQDDPADAVIVTATRTAVTADETLASVTVITRKEIEHSQAKSVIELITGIAGIDANVSGGYGKTTGVFLRGTNSDHVVVLIDGVRIGSPTLGEVSWQYLPTEQIERIEIVRGPHSSLYGADAIGGVIQIFTRQGKEGFRGGASAGYGSHNTREYTANISGAQSGSHYSASAARFQTDGFNARTIAAANEPDNDGFRNDSFSANAGHRFANGAEINAHLLHAQGHNLYDGSFQNENNFIQNAVGADLRFAPTSLWNVRLAAGRSRDDSTDFLNGVFASNYYTTRRTTSWQNDFALAPKQLFTLGIDEQKDLVDSSTPFNATSRKNVGYFAQHQAGLGDHDVLVSFRRDDSYAFGTHDTGNLAWGYAVRGERLRVMASYGTAFKAPTLNQLYDPFVGNPDIKPEEARGAELGLRGKERWGKWDVRGFETRIDNLIIFQPPTYQAININRARIRGLETQVSGGTDRDRVALNLTLLDPRDADTGKLLPRRAQRSVRVDVSHNFEALQIGADWLVQSYRYDDPANTTRLGGYGLVNLTARYDLGKQWFLRARADNILDKEYQTAATYNSLRRSYFMAIGYQTR